MTSIADRPDSLAGHPAVGPWLRMRSSFVFGLAVTAIPLVLLAPNLLWPHGDAAIFAVVGEGLSRGELPYLDLWDHKPPGIYIVTALATLLPGAVWPAIWGLAVAAIALTGILLRSIVGAYMALLAVACLSLYPAALGGGYSETFGALAAVGAVHWAIKGRPVTAGLFASLAALLSIQFLPAVLALVLMAAPLAYALGVAVPLSATAVLLGVAGALPAATDALVVYTRAYLSSSPDRDPTWHIPLVLAPVAVPALLRGTWSLTRLERMAAVWLILGFIVIALQSRHFGHHATALVIPIAILGARATTRSMAFGAATLAGVLVATATIAIFPQSGPATARIGQWVAAHTEGEDAVLVWGFEPNVYLVAERQVAGRYPYLLPLVTPGYSTPRQVNSWISDLEADPPAVIVDAEAAVSYWPDGDDFLRPPPPGAAGGRTLDILDPFRAWVATNYVLAEEIDGRKIYVLRD